jgi:hypothetical protein
MNKLFTVRTRAARAAIAATAGLLLLTGTVAASPAGLRDMGVANVQGGGYWGIEVTTTDNVIAGGYSFARVTNGSCDAVTSAALVFEAYLSPTEAPDGSWVGQLYPVTAAAEAVAGDDGVEGQAVFEPVGTGTHVSAYLEGMPEGHDFRLCLAR